jgi:hypothetical protein
MGHSATLLQQLAGIESEIGRLDERLALANQPLDLAFSLESIRDFVSREVLDFKAAFDSEPTKARQTLAKHIEKLILTPRETENGPLYDVSGDIDLFGGDSYGYGSRSQGHIGASARRGKECNAGGGQRRLCPALHPTFDPNYGADTSTCGVTNSPFTKGIIISRRLS